MKTLLSVLLFCVTCAASLAQKVDYKINPRTGKFDMVGTGRTGNTTDISNLMNLLYEKLALNFATVATSGSYNDLKDKPNISGQIEIQGNTMMMLLDASQLKPATFYNLSFLSEDNPNVENLNIYLKGSTDGTYRLGMFSSLCLENQPSLKNISIYTLKGDGASISGDLLSPGDIVIFQDLFLRSCHLYVACNVSIEFPNRSAANYRNVLNATLNIEGNLNVGQQSLWYFNTIRVGGTFSCPVSNFGKGNIIYAKETGTISPYSLLYENNRVFVGNGLFNLASHE
jgi:hypothetical protein